MTRRRGLWARTVIVTALGVAMLTPATPATAADNPYAQLSCGTGWVQTTAPYVLARQGARGANGPDAFWIARLWRHDGRSWAPLAWGNWYVSPVQTSDFNLGSTVGYAGPNWYPYGTINGQWTGSIYWPVTSGYWYAIENWVNDGTWSSALAGPVGQQVCRA